jgi:hypothetical protein
MCGLTASLHVCDPAGQVSHSTHIAYSWMTNCYFQAKTPAVDPTVTTDLVSHSWTANVQLNLKYATRTTNETVVWNCWFTSWVLLVWIIQEESSVNSTKVTNTVATESASSVKANHHCMQSWGSSHQLVSLRSIQKYNNNVPHITDWAKTHSDLIFMSGGCTQSQMWAAVGTTVIGPPKSVPAFLLQWKLCVG